MTKNIEQFEPNYNYGEELMYDYFPEVNLFSEDFLQENDLIKETEIKKVVTNYFENSTDDDIEEKTKDFLLRVATEANKVYGEKETELLNINDIMLKVTKEVREQLKNNNDLALNLDFLVSQLERVNASQFNIDEQENKLSKLRNKTFSGCKYDNYKYPTFDGTIEQLEDDINYSLKFDQINTKQMERLSNLLMITGRLIDEDRFTEKKLIDLAKIIDLYQTEQDIIKLKNQFKSNNQDIRVEIEEEYINDMLNIKWKDFVENAFSAKIDLVPRRQNEEYKEELRKVKEEINKIKSDFAHRNEARKFQIMHPDLSDETEKRIAFGILNKNYMVSLLSVLTCNEITSDEEDALETTREFEMGYQKVKKQIKKQD